MGAGIAEKSTDAITALLNERRRYEQWLATLESRRAITPGHVYARVHGDYQARLSGVLDQLGGRSAELQQSVEALSARLAALEAEENARRDERSEAELRAAVGEYTQERWLELSEATDAEIVRLTADRSEATAELAQLQQLLTMAKSRRPELVPPVAPPVAPPLAPPSAVAAPVAPPTAVPAIVPPPPAPEVPRLRAPEPRTADGALRRPLAAPAPPADKPLADRPPAPRGEPKTEPTMFDELEFLKSVVDPRAEGKGGAPAAPAPKPVERPRTPMSVPAAPPGGAARAAAAQAPAAGRRLATPPEAGTLNDISVPEKRSDPTRKTGEGDAVPVFLRDVPTEQVKTLKCSECGSMNYPTEWYCERCGGELAAM